MSTVNTDGFNVHYTELHPDTGPIDFHYFSRVRATGDTDFLKDYIDDLKGTLEEALAQLQQAVTSHDITAWTFALHTIISTARDAGAVALTSWVETIKTSPVEQVLKAETVAHIEHILQDAVDALDDYLNNQLSA